MIKQKIFYHFFKLIFFMEINEFIISVFLMIILKEIKEVREVREVNFPFSHGNYIVKMVLCSIDPLDKRT